MRRKTCFAYCAALAFKKKINIMKTSKTILAAVAAATLIAGCAKKEEAPLQIPPAPVVLSPAQQKDVFKFIDTLGTVNSLQSVKIIPQVTGQILKINFKQGQDVKEGDILAEIDKRQYHANVLAAEAAVARAKSQLKIDELDASRNKKLAEQNFVSKQTYDSLVARVESDKAALKSAEADLELAKINLDWCDVRAPISGKAGFFNIDLGNIVNANNPSSLITTIEQTDTLYVDFFVPSSRQSEVQSLMKERGGALELNVSYVSDKGATPRTAKAKVVAVENRARYSSATLVLRAVMDNKDSLFWPDQPVKVGLDMQEVKGAILVNNAAIQVDNVGHFVYVAEPLEGGLYKIKKVKVGLGQLYPDGSYLVEGLKAGDKVVSYGQLRVADGELAYAATEQGVPFGADGKPITDPQKIKEFIANATQIKAKYQAQALAAAQKKPDEGGAKQAGAPKPAAQTAQADTARKSK